MPAEATAIDNGPDTCVQPVGRMVLRLPYSNSDLLHGQLRNLIDAR
ncbi:MAG TPA: hypothetical protein VND23_01655 [Acidimicrobiales bacterium]|nr:hypothetical protein [Acidimicrobiales bacterium]